MMNDRFYLLKIKLMDIEPEIWRRFAVPAEITLDRLHDAIQIIMGWTDSHLHTFTFGKKRFTENPESKEDGMEDSDYRLGDLIKQKGRVFQYDYDFGDSWMHEIILEDNRYIKAQPWPLIECLAGERACPPEDVGGIDGYLDFCDALKDPEHEEHESCLEWSGGDFDSEAFDVFAINDELMKYMRWSRDRNQPWHVK